MHIRMILLQPFLALLRSAAILAVLGRAMRISLVILSHSLSGEMHIENGENECVPLAEACRLD